METDYISKEQIENRKYWISEISRLSGDFSGDSDRVEQHLTHEVQEAGIRPLIGHLRQCGAIPECYGHDSSEEELYSKYTDVVIHEAFKAMGFTSVVLSERANVADVECVADTYSFVADAKAFRLSRTAKNQKDFKVQAMDAWKHGKPYALIVCPVYQLPSRASQIYQQAAERSVCIATYTHLAVLARFAEVSTKRTTQQIVREIFKTVEAMNPSRDAVSYWQAVNRTLLESDTKISEIWKEEKLASHEAMHISKMEALSFLAEARTRIMSMSRNEAITEVLKYSRIANKVKTVQAVTERGILNLE